MPTESNTEQLVDGQRTHVAQGADSDPHAGGQAAGLVLWTGDGKILVGWGAEKREWSEPGGKRERGETTRACATRELYEETRLCADDLEIEWERPSYDAHCHYTFYQGRLGDRRPEPTVVFTEFKYVHPRDAPVDYTFRLKRVVAALDNPVLRPRPVDLTNCRTGPVTAAPAEAPRKTGTGRAKKGTKRKFDVVSSQSEETASVLGDSPMGAAEHGTSASPEISMGAGVSAGGSALLSAKGRRVVLCDVQYKIDAAALEAYAETPEAKTTRASCDESKARSRLTEHELIKRFLGSGRVKRLPDGTGVCTFSYTASPIGEELFRQGFLENGGRLYPDLWPSVTDLPKKLRNCALGAHCIEMDDSNAFHRYLQSLTTSSSAHAALEELVQDRSYRACLA